MKIKIFSAQALALIFATSVQASEFDPVSSGIRMMGGLLVVLAIIFGLYFLLRNRMSALQQQGKGIINVIEVRHVMPKKTLMLVEVRGREFLVGAGGDSINTIVPMQTGSSFASVLEQSEKKRL